MKKVETLLRAHPYPKMSRLMSCTIHDISRAHINDATRRNSRQANNDNRYRQVKSNISVLCVIIRIDYRESGNTRTNSIFLVIERRSCGCLQVAELVTKTPNLNDAIKSRIHVENIQKDIKDSAYVNVSTLELHSDNV